MKHINKNLFFLLSFLMILGACEKKELVTLNPDAKPVLNLSTTDLVLDENTPDAQALVVSWIEPDYGFQAAPSYTLMMDLATGDFSNPQKFSVGGELKKTFTNAELNSKLLALGVDPENPTQIKFMVEAKLSQQVKIYSDPVTMTVTAYSSYLDLSTDWGIVGSATPGGWGNPDLPDLPMYKTSDPNVLVAYVGLQTGEFKFRLNNDWAVNYGDNGNDGTLEQDGANIPVTEGTYKITVNIADLTYTIEPYSWGIVGSAAPHGWNGPDIPFYYNPYNDNWVAVATLTDGEIKFRLNNDWGTNYGDSGADGTLDAGGDNISVTAGHYLITMDLNDMTYTIESADLWGLVGSAAPNGWNGPDVKFVPKFGPEEGKFYIYNVQLNDGEVKVRLNDDWGTNYGDDGNDGTLEPGGANIPVTAGKYYIKLDFTASPPNIKFIQWP